MFVTDGKQNDDLAYDDSLRNIQVIEDEDPQNALKYADDEDEVHQEHGDDGLGSSILVVGSSLSAATRTASDAGGNGTAVHGGMLSSEHDDGVVYDIGRKTGMCGASCGHIPDMRRTELHHVLFLFLFPLPRDAGCSVSLPGRRLAFFSVFGVSQPDQTAICSSASHDIVPFAGRSSSLSNHCAAIVPVILPIVSAAAFGFVFIPWSAESTWTSHVVHFIFSITASRFSREHIASLVPVTNNTRKSAGTSIKMPSLIELEDCSG